ncbi:hypothetical protein J6Z19_05075 [bacterium]|nr:hypothetical protein [bacterium]
MKKLSVLFLALFFCFACSSENSGDKEKNDSDSVEVNGADTTDESDTDTANDSENAEVSDDSDNTDISDESETTDSDAVENSETDTPEDPDTNAPVSDDGDSVDDSDSESDDSDSGCPSGFECKGGYCANTSDPKFFCAENSDCGENLTCTSSSLPTGQCHGCSYASDCPGGGTDDAVRCVQAGSSGYCMRICHADEDCSEGMACRTSGLGSFCGKKDCSKPSDCPANYTCTPSSDSSEGSYCTRIPCK